MDYRNDLKRHSLYYCTVTHGGCGHALSSDSQVEETEQLV